MRAKSIYLVLGLATVLSAGQTKISRDLTAVQGSAPVRVILQYRTPSNQGRLRQLAAAYSADELMVLTITGDYASRLESYELLAGAFGLAGGA